MKTIEEMAVEIRAANIAAGWRAADGSCSNTFGDDIALLHSEVTEAFEAYRSWKFDDATVTGTVGTLPKPEGVGSELADVFIRLLDTCDRRGIDLRAEYERKIAYNRIRSFRHGGRAL